GSTQLCIAGDQFSLSIYSRRAYQMEEFLSDSMDVDRKRCTTIQHQRKPNFLLELRRVGCHLPEVEQTARNSTAVAIAYLARSKRLLMTCPRRTSIPAATPCAWPD